jgi:L-alanine-DL-glutamate epimerase-like enolase superfamily enzyme
MANVARSYTDARALKLKLTGEQVDLDRVVAVREARPETWIGVDANQGFTRASLEKLMPTLIAARIQLIEQPFPTGQEALLDGLQSPIPIAADESVQCLSDIPGLVGRFNLINIKLDKCGGLTEALEMTGIAKIRGLGVMVGNMLSTSLAMAPAFVVGQLCDIVDLDGPVFLGRDRDSGLTYKDGYVSCPEKLWGGRSHPG